MGKTVILIGLTGSVLALVTAGCTLKGIEKSRNEAAGSNLALSNPSPEALAGYSMAVRSGIEGDADAVIRHYKTAISEDPANLSIKMELALILLHQGDLDDCISLSDQIITREPENQKALQLKALALRIAGRKEESLETLKRAALADPSDPASHMEVAAAYILMKNTQGAIDYLEGVVYRIQPAEKIYESLGELYVSQARADLGSGRELDADHLPKLFSAAEKYPGNFAIRVCRGELLVLHGKINEAVVTLDQAQKLTTRDLQIRRILGSAIASLPQRSSAIELLIQATAENPQDQRLWIYLSELYEMEQQPQMAVDALKKATALESATDEAYLRLAHLLIKQDETNQAASTLQAALIKYPDEHRIYELKGYMSLRDQQYHAAAEAFEQAGKLIGKSGNKPFLKNFYLNAALANQMSGQLDKAAELLRDGFAQDPEIIEQFMALAFQAIDKSGHVDAALEILDKVADLLPREPGTYTMFGLLAMRSENYPAALSMLEQAREMAVDAGDQEESLDAQFYFWLGSAAERNGLFDKAEEYFLEAIRRQPDHADSHNYLAYMLAERAIKLDMAMDHVAVALAVEPDNPAYIDTRGWIYYQLGDYTNALTDISKAHELLPEDPTISEHLGDVYLRLGNRHMASNYWSKALHLEPANTNLMIKIEGVGPASHPDNPVGDGQPAVPQYQVPVTLSPF